MLGGNLGKRCIFGTSVSESKRNEELRSIYCLYWSLLTRSGRVSSGFKIYFFLNSLEPETFCPFQMDSEYDFFFLNSLSQIILSRCVTQHV